VDLIRATVRRISGPVASATKLTYCCDMDSRFTIREAGSDDIKQLLDLYLHLSAKNSPFHLTRAKEALSEFSRYDGSAILLGEVDGVLVSSCALVVVPNLTWQGAPYALVENVVTHGDHRRKGYGKLVLDEATKRAWDCGCYKIMLMTGSKEQATLAFYENVGFEQSKTGFQKRRSLS